MIEWKPTVKNTRITDKFKHFINTPSTMLFYLEGNIVEGKTLHVVTTKYEEELFSNMDFSKCALYDIIKKEDGIYIKYVESEYNLM